MKPHVLEILHGWTNQKYSFNQYYITNIFYQYYEISNVRKHKYNVQTILLPWPARILCMEPVLQIQVGFSPKFTELLHTIAEWTQV